MTAALDWTHLASDIPSRGLSETRHATADELIELARMLDVLAVESLAVSYDVKPMAGGHFHFTGELEAKLTQACVISLEPVPATISEAFAIELAPAEDTAVDKEQTLDGDQEILSAPDLETFAEGRIEAGKLVFDIVSAALEPYPRAAGAEFNWVDPKVAENPGAASPFAALAKLKPKES